MISLKNQMKSKALYSTLPHKKGLRILRITDLIHNTQKTKLLKKKTTRPKNNQNLQIFCKKAKNHPNYWVFNWVNKMLKNSRDSYRIDNKCENLQHFTRGGISKNFGYPTPCNYFYVL